MAEILQGDVIEVLRGYADESFTCTLSDPPYGLEFMGKDWDHGVPGVPYWAEVLRVLKPGGVLMAFGGSRTHHRLMVAIEDAGFEIFDCMMFLHGQGFPKSHDISKAIDKAAGAEREGAISGGHIGVSEHGGDGRNDNELEMRVPHVIGKGSFTRGEPATPDAETWSGFGTALKPATEFICCARKPRRTTYAATALEHGSGALNIEACRIRTNGERPAREGLAIGYGADGHSKAIGTTSQGRWPSNLLLSHSPGCVRRGERRVKGDPKSTRGAGSDIYGNGKGYTAEMPELGQAIGYADADGLETVAAWECVADCAVRLLGEQSGESKSVYSNTPQPIKTSKGHKGGAFGNPSARRPDGHETHASYIRGGYVDSGSCSRFFKNFDPPLRFKYSAKASRAERDSGLPDGERSGHPCMKPLAVTRYLATLLRPPEAYLDDATILVPFAGSCSEAIGALLAGWRNIVAIELSEEYCQIGRVRLRWWAKAMALTHETEPQAILAAMKGRDIDEPVQAALFNGGLT